jgi:hypothetical protein
MLSDRDLVALAVIAGVTAGLIANPPSGAVLLTLALGFGAWLLVTWLFRGLGRLSNAFFRRLAPSTHWLRSRPLIRRTCGWLADARTLLARPLPAPRSIDLIVRYVPAAFFATVLVIGLARLVLDIVVGR